MKKSLLLLVLMAAMVLPAFASGDKETYPSETINIVVPSKAGGSTDGCARQFAQIAKNTGKMLTL